MTTAAKQDRYVLIENVNMIFNTKKGSFQALKDINLSIQEGEFISIIGHSGCGKSTVLNLIAGLLQPTDGYLFCAGREIAKPGPERAVVFQNHSLLPWLTCFQNVYLAVERGLALLKASPSWQNVPALPWSWWASAMPRKNARMKSLVA
jgi:nitrate/nitrite transport system ATP-binding protein